MGTPYIGEIRMFGGSFAPVGWAMCQGQLMPVSQNETLFNLIGTTYGGDGQKTFGIPDLRGRAPMHAGQGPGITQNYQLGEMAGAETVTVTVNQIPIHNHAMLASGDSATAITGANGIVANAVQLTMYFAAPADSGLNSQAVQPVGGSQPHENMQPYLVVTFILSLFGVFPRQT